MTSFIQVILRFPARFQYPRPLSVCLSLSLLLSCPVPSSLPPSLPLRFFSRSFLHDTFPSSAFDISLAIRPFMLRYKFALKARRLSPSKTPSPGHVRSLQHPPPSPLPLSHTTCSSFFLLRVILFSSPSPC